MQTLKAIVHFGLICALLLLGKAKGNDVQEMYRSLFVQRTPTLKLWKTAEMLQSLGDQLTGSSASDYSLELRDEINKAKGVTVIRADQCNQQSLQARANLYDEYAKKGFGDMMNLLDYANRLQLNLCLREFDERWLTSVLDLPNDLLVRAFEILRPINPAVASKDNVPKSELRYDPGARNKAAHVAYYLKYHVNGIERKHFDSEMDHRSFLTEAYYSFKRELCEPAFFIMSEEHDKFKGSQVPELDGFKRVDRSALWLKLQMACTREIEEENIYQQFMDRFDSIEMKEKKVDQLTADEIRQFLFATRNQNLRTGPTIELLKRLLNLSGPNDEVDLIELKSLIALNELADSKCDRESQSARSTLLKWYDEHYVNLHPYVASLNELQTEICYQSVRFEAAQFTSSESLIKITRLDRIGELIESSFRSSGPLSELNISQVKQRELNSAIAKFQSESKGAPIEQLVLDACEKAFPSLKETIIRYELLKSFGINRLSFGQQTLKVIGYAKLCAAKLRNQTEFGSPGLEPRTPTKISWFKKPSW